MIFCNFLIENESKNETRLHSTGPNLAHGFAATAWPKGQKGPDRPSQAGWPLQRCPACGHHCLGPCGGSPAASGWQGRWHENEDGRREALGNKGATEVYRTAGSTWRRQFGSARRHTWVAAPMRWSPATERGSCSFRKRGTRTLVWGRAKGKERGAGHVGTHIKGGRWWGEKGRGDPALGAPCGGAGGLAGCSRGHDEGRAPASVARGSGGGG
jgi:hypothetical protein